MDESTTQEYFHFSRALRIVGFDQPLVSKSRLCHLVEFVLIGQCWLNQLITYHRYFLCFLESYATYDKYDARVADIAFTCSVLF